MKDSVETTNSKETAGGGKDMSLFQHVAKTLAPLQQKHLRYLEQVEEMGVRAQQKVSQLPHIILGTFGQSSYILGQKFGGCYTWNKNYMKVTFLNPNQT